MVLTRSPFEPPKSSSDEHLTWEMCFQLFLALANRVTELHDLSFCVQHSVGWKVCTFSFVLDFMAKTQNPSIHNPRIEGFTIPSQDDFVDGDRDELLLCPLELSGST